MEYSFLGSIITEGNRNYISIPFNVWEATGEKGLIPVQVIIKQSTFECKLVPKGKGNYLIPIKKDFIKKLSLKSDFNVIFKLIDCLSRINSNSPYSKANPIRRIDSITFIEGENGLCGQACVAMLTGLTLDDIIKKMKATKWQASMSKIIETLDYYGIHHNNKMVYKLEDNQQLPLCCILNSHGHFLIHFKGSFYNPSKGISKEYPLNLITGFLEITI